MEIEESGPGEDVVESKRSKLLSIEYQSGEDIGLSTGSDTNGGAHSDNVGDNVANFSDILSVSSVSLLSDDSLLNDSSVEEIDPFDIESLSEDTDLDEEDVAAFHEDIKEAHSDKVEVVDERKDSWVGSSQEESSSSPSKTKSPVKEKQLAKQRKEVLKKIRHLPISERFILHGRNLLPWNQKVIKRNYKLFFRWLRL